MELKINNLLSKKPDSFDITGLQPFVLSESAFERQTNLTMADINNTDVLATPFELFSIEVEGDIVLAHDGYVKIIAIVVREISFNNYEYLVEAVDNVNSMGWWIKGDDPMKPAIQAVVKECLTRIHSSRLGRINTTGRIKYKDSKGKKQIWKPRGVIYLQPRAAINKRQDTTACGVHIRHCDAWSVMSHYRKLNNPESKGLNRTGDRVVKGYTWVDAYAKGQDRDLQQTKIRKVM